MAASASQASLVKWSRTRRSQMGRNGEDRPGWVPSSTISSKTKSPEINRPYKINIFSNVRLIFVILNNIIFLLLKKKRTIQ